jgi:hypothetical protein
MTTTFPLQKSPKTAFWTKVEDELPKNEEALYLIVMDGMVGFAWYRKDGNGNFAFNKEGVTHWAPTPKLPEA